MSKLTPIDVPHKEFQKSFRGYAPRDVLLFLQEIANEWEEALRENKQLRDKVQDQSEHIERLMENEKGLKETLFTAQKMSEQLGAAAKKESDLVIGQAEIQAEKILQQAHERMMEVIGQINHLKKQRAEFQGALRGMIDTHLRLLAMDPEDQTQSRIENVGLINKASSGS